MDQKLFNNDKVKFDVDDELDAIEKARLFVADVCQSLDNLPAVQPQQPQALVNVVSVDDETGNNEEDDMLAAVVSEEEKQPTGNQSIKQ